MKVEINVKVKSGKRYQDVDDIDTLVNAIKNNPFYFLDLELIDRTSVLFPEFIQPEDIANPFFE